MAFKKTEKKDPFEGLPEDFKKSVEAADLDGLKMLFSGVAKGEQANRSAKKADEDLNNLLEQVKVASSGYAEVTKANKTKASYLIRFLADKGDPVAQSIVQNEIDAAMQKG
jgi:hypothetical protein